MVILKDFREGEEKYRSNQKRDYDECHRTRHLPDLPDNSPVWVDMPPNGQIPGNVVTAAPKPRSYIVSVPSGQVRRNRSQLHERNCLPSEVTQGESTGIQTRLKTGTEIHPPQRYQN